MEEINKILKTLSPIERKKYLKDNKEKIKLLKQGKINK